MYMEDERFKDKGKGFEITQGRGLIAAHKDIKEGLNGVVAFTVIG